MTKDQEERLVKALEAIAAQRSTLERQLAQLAGVLEALSHQVVAAATILSRFSAAQKRAYGALPDKTGIAGPHKRVNTTT